MKHVRQFITSDLFILGAGKVIQMVLMFVAVKLFTTYLTDIELGNLILIMAVASFFGLALINPIGGFINRKLYSWVEQGVVLARLANFNYYVAAVAIGALVLPWLLALIGVGMSIETTWFSLVLCLFIYFNTWNQTIIPALNLLYYRKAFVIFTILSAVGYLLAAVLLVLYVDAKAQWWVLGQVTGLVIGFFVAVIFFFKALNLSFSLDAFRLNKEGITKVFSFSLPLAGATLLMWILLNSYKLIVEARLGAEELAQVGLGLILATSISGAVESLVMQIYHAHFYKGLSGAKGVEERSHVFQRFINQTVPIVFAALMMLSIVSPYLISLLADQRFLGAYIFLMIGLLVESLRVVTNILSHAAHSEFKTKANIQPYLWGALFAAISVYFVTYLEGWQVLLPWLLFISWLITVTLMFKGMLKLLTFHFPWQRLFKTFLFMIPLAFVSWIFVNEAKSILVSLVILSTACVCFIGVVYLGYRKGELNA